jgi:multisubunit Na+/H+ antiporter MnhC subunit
VAAAVTGLRRFYLYAVLTLLFNIAGVLLAVNEGLMTVLLGLTIFAVGAWLLSRFLRAYPLPEEEEGRGR